MGSYNISRNLFKRALSTVAPEDFENIALFWTTFERLHGTLDTYEESKKRIENRRVEVRQALKKASIETVVTP